MSNGNGTNGTPTTKMSFGGSDERDCKRKYHWSAYKRGAKRFHGISDNPRAEYHRGGGSRWDRAPRTQESFSKSHQPPGYSRANRGKTNYNRFPHPTNNRNYNHTFEFQPSVSSGPARECEEIVGPGSDIERMEKVLATKKRIEEALASNSSNSNNKDISFQNSSISSEGKNKEKESHGPNLDLRLTNSDFKEIGSVASAVSTEGDVETSDFIINTSPNITAHISQQRSFDNTSINPPANVQIPQLKSQKVGGWTMSGMNEIITEPNKSCPLRPRNDMYLLEQREEILGNVSTSSKDNTIEHSHSMQSYDNEDCSDEFSRVGRLYQSFLKSRLFGCTLKVRSKSQKLIGPNPLLDKSVLDGPSSAEPNQEQVLELHMPQPIRVKIENNEELITPSTPDHIAAEEANEFCKEFSFLLTDPNFLIPPDNLEKLGLGHLSEMNKLINDKRNGGTSRILVDNQDSFLQQKNVDAVNFVTGNDVAVNINQVNPVFGTLNNVGIRGSVDKIPETDIILNNSISNNESSSTSVSQGVLSMDQTMRPDVLRKENTFLTLSPQVSQLQNVSVEAVVEKVVKTILQPSNISTVLNSTPDARTNSTKHANESHFLGEPSSNEAKISPLNQMQDVSSKILRLFLIDKQVEELMAEKMKIYSELLSSQGVSQTLFHSWAQDQIQQGNVMSVISNTSNVIPELNRVMNRTVQETKSLQTSNAELEETISELYSLKKEYENANVTTPQTIESNSCEPSMLPPDTNFSTPKDVVMEENRPKLSVRKDLLDPNRSHVNLLNTSVEISPMCSELNVNPSDCMNSAQSDKTATKCEKKKKKSKKKDSLEVINLIEDTDDEISNATGIEPVAGLNPEEEVDKKEKESAGILKLSYELNGKMATCMTVVKVKKTQTRVMVVGCKDGFVMGYLISNPAISFTKKIHNDTIMTLFCVNKYLITGSSDSTICLFSLKEQVESQRLTVNAPVQSMDINIGQLIVGTKAGSIYSYTIKQVAGNKKNMSVSLLPNKKALAITNSSILAVKLAKEGARKVLIVASRGEQITVRDATSGLLLRTFDWCDTVYCLQLYEETPLVYCGTNTKSVKVVNFTDGENTGDCIMGRSITHIVFLHSIMFAASYDGNIYIYNVEKKSLMATVMISKGIIQCLAIDNKTNVILVASTRGDLQQIPFPTSVLKLFKKLKIEKKKNQIKPLTQP